MSKHIPLTNKTGTGSEVLCCMTCSPLYVQKHACIFKRQATLMTTRNVNLIELTPCTEWQESIIASNGGCNQEGC